MCQHGEMHKSIYNDVYSQQCPSIENDFSMLSEYEYLCTRSGETLTPKSDRLEKRGQAPA